MSIDDFDQGQFDADIQLGFAEQNVCETRDDLVAYAKEHNLTQHLHFFLERRGWLDDDWQERLEKLEAEQRQPAKKYSSEEASPDDPIYKHGFAIAGKRIGKKPPKK